MNKPIQSVSEYISEVKNKIEKSKIEYSVVVFRGETKAYATPCQPNIFRTNLAQSDEFFEKNLFEEMTANHLTNGKTYLEIAIDAQHGGFPSRLLDVTYNCLTALYFAVTPYYTEKETAYDNDDGRVYIFFLEDMYCPTGKNINQAYDACINHDPHWLSEHELFQKNHKLIDHIKKNPRIIAQQGAFILFQGDYLSSFPDYRYEVIEIAGNKKAQIRNDLRLYFGIHTGTIYPEEFNLVNEMVRKTSQVSSRPFSIYNELELTFHNIEVAVKSCLDKLEIAHGNEYLKIITEAEREMFSYHSCMKEFLVAAVKEKEIGSAECDQYKDRFNKIIENFAFEAEGMMEEYENYAMKISCQELCIE